MKRENRLSTNAGQALPFATDCPHNGSMLLLRVANG